MLVDSIIVFLFMLCALAAGLIILTFFAILSEIARFLDARAARKFQSKRDAERVLL